MTAMVIIGLLAVILTPSFARVRENARAAACTGNLKSLFVATNSYIQDKGHWPQVVGNVASEPFANGWLQELQPYGISKENWLCPAIKAAIHYTEKSPFRLDYIPTPFGAKQVDPFRWPTHPWFAERGSVHGKGNLIVLTNGSIKPLSEITGNSQSAPE